MKEALVIVDVQNDYFPNGKFPTDSPVETAEAIAKLIQKFREEKKEVVHVTHVVPNPTEKFPFFQEGTWGVQVHDLVKPLPTEKYIVKNYSNGFHETDLEEHLRSKGIDRIIVVGMMIHNCVNATVYAGKDAGFDCIVVDEAVNTFDQALHGEVIKAKDIKKAFLAGIQFYYAKVLKLEDVLSNDY
ncbi:Isochorismatase hydrolase [Rhizopus microsporus var. microsporus]|uniref:Isochorismatase hydrolase n=2 Tax=Rhizopus microsporus TaxID=58291 RepID=A0A2G4SIS5_RHIZD|nr:isochorismatase hydrolase [Rhizopus microsporus ATCC 52813]XP_023462382.1 isochorismatase hydrolase [Rhizopus microsporus ATCC 52813]XP_023462386.1 isochorismatase hydrolase [Rhizopus microsporus ATCC 52813]ORE00873.1 Isochorismatase hydrolase [Rhizopus microsporus var. microsporus]PHZ08671.1 isochorismatase hydrolase [Rhizopus microsporus ATCC 52813]PHZ08674.1 isochorismatase hydrolase [Rhizopus microsporus ATCC 52813]PHZ08678.1 isochorismatase hydrolase [Rhizopus microsporus ATCC 52813]